MNKSRSALCVEVGSGSALVCTDNTREQKVDSEGRADNEQLAEVSMPPCDVTKACFSLTFLSSKGVTFVISGHFTVHYAI